MLRNHRSKARSKSPSPLSRRGYRPTLERLEQRNLLATRVLDFNNLFGNTSVPSPVVEDGFVVQSLNGGTMATRGAGYPFTAAQGITLYQPVASGQTRITRADGGNFQLSSIQLNSLSVFASSVVPFNYTASAGGTGSFSFVTDSNYSTFQTFMPPSSVNLSSLQWQQLGNAGDYHQFDNVTLTIGPTISALAPVTPDPRATSVPNVQITFSEAINVSSFTHADLTLTRDGTPVALDGTISVSHVAGTTYAIQGLSAFTSEDGDYVLTVNALNILSPTGLQGAGTATESWTKETTYGPRSVAVVESQVESPTLTPVGAGWTLVDGLEHTFTLDDAQTVQVQGIAQAISAAGQGNVELRLVVDGAPGPVIQSGKTTYAQELQYPGVMDSSVEPVGVVSEGFGTEWRLLPEPATSASANFSSGGLVSVPDSPALSIPTGGAMSFEAWIHPQSYGSGNSSLFRKWDSNTGQREYALFMNSGGYLLFSNIQGGQIGTSTPVPLGVWSHIGVVVNNGQVSIYRNGTLIGSGGVNPFFGDSTAPLEIGGEQDMPYSFPGRISEAAVYPYALGATDFAQHAGTTGARDYRDAVLAANPLGYWRLNEDAGATTALDSSSAQRHGAAIGGPSFGQSGALQDQIVPFNESQVVFSTIGYEGTVRLPYLDYLSLDAGPHTIQLQARLTNGATLSSVDLNSILMKINLPYDEAETSDFSSTAQGGGWEQLDNLQTTVDLAEAGSVSVAGVLSAVSTAGTGDLQVRLVVDGVAGPVIQAGQTSYGQELQYPGVMDSSVQPVGVVSEGFGTEWKLLPNSESSKSASFSGGAQVSVPDHSAFSIPSGGAMTFEAWINPDSYGAGNKTILRKWDSGGGQVEYALYLSSTGTLIFQNAQGGGVVSSTSIPLNTWSHVAATVNNGFVTLYRNGSLISTGSVNPFFGDSNAPLEIGGDQGTSMYFSGRIDEAAVYPYALSAGTLAQHFAISGTADYRDAVLAANPVGYWRLNEAAGATTAVDSSPYLRHGSVIGGLQFNQPGALQDQDVPFEQNQVVFSTIEYTGVAHVPFHQYLDLPAGQHTIGIQVLRNGVELVETAELRAMPLVVGSLSLGETAATSVPNSNQSLGGAWQNVAGLSTVVEGLGGVTLIQGGLNLATNAGQGEIELRLLVDGAPGPVIQTGQTSYGQSLQYPGLMDVNTQPVGVVSEGFGTQWNLLPESETSTSAQFASGTEVRVPDDSVYSIPTGGAMTFEAWINPQNYGSGVSTILRKWDNGNGQYEYAFYLNSSGYLIFQNFQGGGVSSSVPMSLNSWSHVAAVVNNGQVSLYRNGVLLGASSVNSFFGDTSAPFEIGGDQGTPYFFSGRIDEVAVYPYALAPGTLAQHYNTPGARDYRDAVLAANPVGYWRLNEAAGETTVIDSSSAQRHGSAIGALQFGQAGPLSSQTVPFNESRVVFSTISYDGAALVPFQENLLLEPGQHTIQVQARVVAGAVSLNGLQSLSTFSFIEEMPTGTTSVTLDGLGNVVVSDVEGVDNRFSIQRVGADIVISDSLASFLSPPGVGALSNGDRTLTIPAALVLGSITFDAAAGNDQLIVDGELGLPLSFDGGAGGNDVLSLTGTGVAAVYTPDATTTGAGVIDLGGPSTVAFTGLEPIDFDVTGGTFTLLLPNGNDSITIANGTLTDASTPALMISGSSGGVAFENARVRGAAIVIDTTAVDGDDAIVIAGANNAHTNTDLVIDTGLGDDGVQFNGAASFAGTISITTSNVNSTPSSFLSTNGIEMAISGVASTLAGPLYGSGGLVKSGDGVLKLSGNSSYSGVTRVDAGVLHAAGSTALGANGVGNETVVADGATLEISGGNAFLESFTLYGDGINGDGALFNASGSFSLWGGITLAGDAAIGGAAGVGNQIFLINNGISEAGGSRSLDLVGAANVVMQTGNSYTGTTTVKGAGSALYLRGPGPKILGDLIIGDGVHSNIVSLDASNQIADSSRVTIETHSRFVRGPYGGTVADAIDQLSGMGSIEGNSLGALSLTVGAAGGSSTFQGTISDGVGGQPVSLTKAGAGTLVLTGAHSYTGATTVDNGTLLVAGSLDAASVVSVRGAGTFGGTGVAAGSINVSNNGVVSPGLAGATGVLTTGAVSFASGAFSVAINGAAAGADYDRLNVAGSVNLGSGVATLSLSGSHVPVIGQSFVLITNDGTEDVLGYFKGAGGAPLYEGSPLSFNGQTLYITYNGGDGNDVELNTHAIVNGTEGADSLSLTPLAGGGLQYVLNGRTVTLPGPVSSFTFYGREGDDLMTVNLNSYALPSGGVYFHGQDHDAPLNAGANGQHGDVLRVIGTHTQTAAYLPDGVVNPLLDNDGLVTVAGQGTITFTGLEPLDLQNLAVAQIHLPNGSDLLTLAAGLDAATNSQPALVLSGTSGGVAFEQVHLRGNTLVAIDTTISGSDGADVVTVQDVDTTHGNSLVSLNTGGANDQLNFSANTASIAVTLTDRGSIDGFEGLATLPQTSLAFRNFDDLVGGGSTADALQMDLDVAATWNLATLNGGDATVAGPPRSVAYSGFENLVGAPSAADVFIMSPAGGLTGSLNARGPAASLSVGDTLDYTAFTSTVSVDLTSGLATAIGGGIVGDAVGASIEHLWGGSGNDVLVGDADVNLIRGNAGDDVINAKAGVDDVDGGAGSDRIEVEGTEAEFDAIIGGTGGVGDAGDDDLMINVGSGPVTLNGFNSVYNEFANSIDRYDARGLRQGNGGGNDLHLGFTSIVDAPTVDAGPTTTTSRRRTTISTKSPTTAGARTTTT
ncbi:MAG: LamG-like jellyroll fold domain-containing protein [Pirellulales bacterium]